MPVVDGCVFLSQLMNNFGDRMGDSKGFLGYDILDFGQILDFGWWILILGGGWRWWWILILGGGF